MYAKETSESCLSNLHRYGEIVRNKLKMCAEYPSKVF